MTDIFDSYIHPKNVNPIIYAYSDPRYPGCLKIGYTERPIEVRMHEHYPTLLPGEEKPYKVEYTEPALTEPQSESSASVPSGKPSPTDCAHSVAASRILTCDRFHLQRKTDQDLCGGIFRNCSPRVIMWFWLCHSAKIPYTSSTRKQLRR